MGIISVYHKIELRNNFLHESPSKTWSRSGIHDLNGERSRAGLIYVKMTHRPTVVLRRTHTAHAQYVTM